MYPYFYTILGPIYYDNMCTRKNSRQRQYEYELRFDSRIVRGQSRVIFPLTFCVITFEKNFWKIIGICNSSSYHKIVQNSLKLSRNVQHTAGGWQQNAKIGHISWNIYVFVSQKKSLERMDQTSRLPPANLKWYRCVPIESEQIGLQYPVFRP